MIFRMLVVCALFSAMMQVGTGRAEASTVSKWVKNSAVYLYRPIPALWNYGSGLVECVVSKSVQFVTEVVGNINANPATLDPVLPPPVPQPDPAGV